MTKKKKTIEEITTLAETMVVESSSVKDLRPNLEEIKTYNGVIGYILRNSTSATIDLKDPSKIIDYAILSSCSLDASKEVSELFSLGRPKYAFVEGKNINLLSLVVEENSISVFLEKNANWKSILEKLC